MESVINLLSPEQVDSILSVYGSVATWYAQAVDFVATQADNIVIEEIWL